MFTIKLNLPNAVPREVLVEKTDKTNEPFISSKQIKIMKFKKITSVLICLLISFALTYLAIFFSNFNGIISTWVVGERVALLLGTIASFFTLFLYCAHHMMDTNNCIDIHVMSMNWFKKLCLVLIVLIVSSLVVYVVFAFCTMNTNIYKISSDARGSMILITYFITLVLCGLIFHNVIKLFKIEL